MSVQKPADFEEFWSNVLKELAGIPIAPELEPIPMRSTEFADMYGVRVTSIGPYRLYGYLSIPKGGGPFPAIYFAPGNSSVLQMIPQGTANAVRSRYLTFSIACRGMRNSDKPYTAMYPGQLTDGLDSAKNYVYRGIVADTVRGMDFLVSRPEVDEDRILASGNDNALLVAALHDAVTHVISVPSYLFDTLKQATVTSSYPLEEFSDYLRLYPDRADDVASILEFYNLRWHAPAVTAESLLMADHRTGIYNPKILADLEDAITGNVTVHESERSSFKDGMFTEEWTTEKLIGKKAAPIIPEHWQLHR